MLTDVSRRAFLKTAGAVIVAFDLPVELRAETLAPAARPATDLASDQLDAWLAVADDGRVTLFSGKVDLGTGVETALSQIVAGELDIPVTAVTVVQGDTARTPDQGYTVGSKTLQLGAPPIRQAAAEARQVLLDLAAARLGVPAADLSVKDGVVRVAREPGRSVSYGDLIGGRRFNRTVSKTATLKPPDRYTVVGRPVPRVELPAKVTGSHVYVHNVRVPSMLHGRVVRPPAVGATVVSVDERSVAGVPGLVQVVRKGNFVGVVALGEEGAIRSARDLQVQWRLSAALPEMKDLYDEIRRTPATERVNASAGDVEAALRGAARVLRATYRTPFNSHASIGPSCAVADVRHDGATVWSSTQGPNPLRRSLASLLGLPAERVRVVWVEGSGCYGHNGADDAAADAALLSQAVGRPVRVQWMRHDEHGWDPKGPAMVMEVRGGLDRRERSSRGIMASGRPPTRRAPTVSRGRCSRANSPGARPQAPVSSAATATRHTATRSRRIASPPTGFRRARYVPRRSAASARRRTPSPTSRLWMSWRRRPAPIPWRSVCAISAIPVRGRS